MASVTKHPKSQYWTACYTNREGRQVKCSTKSTDRNHAYEIAIELERVERRAKQGTLTNTQIKKVLSDVSEKVTGGHADFSHHRSLFERMVGRCGNTVQAGYARAL